MDQIGNDQSNNDLQALEISDSSSIENETHQSSIDNDNDACQHVTYIIGKGREIIMHRFELDLSPDQTVEMVIKSLDEQIEDMYGRIWLRMD